jgi:nucleoside-diphosphate-sugar epimerase
MKFLITGDKGFVGSETRRFIESMETPVQLSGLTSYTSASKAHVKDHEIIGYDLMDGFDIRDAAQLDSVISAEKPDRILHLAAIARFADADADPQLAFETNVMGTRNVAKVAMKHKIPVVYSSTGSVYMPITDFTGSIKENWPAKGNSVYGCTKYAGETYVRQHNPHIILRYAHLYGREKRMHGLIGGFMERIQRGLAPTLYGGKQSNDFTYIKDIARANYLALTAPWDKWNQVYNIGTGEELSAKKAGEIVCKHAKYTGKIEVKEGRTVDPERFLFDVSKASRMLGFDAKYSFEAGLADMFQE